MIRHVLVAGHVKHIHVDGVIDRRAYALGMCRYCLRLCQSIQFEPIAMVWQIERDGQVVLARMCSPTIFLRRRLGRVAQWFW